MLFSVGTGYFIFVNEMNTFYVRGLTDRGSAMQNQLAENLLIVPEAGSNNHLTLSITNTGATSANVTDVLVTDPIKALHTYGIGFSLNTSPMLPLGLNQGDTVSVDTGLAIAAGQYTIKVLTTTGNVFTATYPITPVPLATLAVTTQGAGLLQINFDSYKAYNASGTGTGCNPTNANCQLANFPAGKLGYTMAPISKGLKFYVYAVNITNVDPSKRTITLDSNSVLLQFQVPKTGTGGGTSSSWSWGIGRVSSSGLTQSWSNLVITPGQSVTLFFTAIPSTNTGGNSWPTSGSYEAVFIYLHGFTGSNAYGQNVPFVTTLYN